MPYEAAATSKTQALVLYVLDVSHSMGQPLGNTTRIDAARYALGEALKQMIFRSTRATRILPRYRVGILSYSEEVFDWLDGFKSIEEVARRGIPQLAPSYRTNTAYALKVAADMLLDELPALGNCPAPLVCHMTDGEFVGEDPEPAARELRALSVSDGNVLLENIFVSDNILPQPIGDPRRWHGVLPDTPLLDDFAIKLRDMSSTLPESYRGILLDEGYTLAPGSKLMFPASSPQLVSLGFQMSTLTGMGR